MLTEVFVNQKSVNVCWYPVKMAPRNTLFTVCLCTCTLIWLIMTSISINISYALLYASFIQRTHNFLVRVIHFYSHLCVKKILEIVMKIKMFLIYNKKIGLEKNCTLCQITHSKGWESSILLPKLLTSIAHIGDVLHVLTRWNKLSV